MSDPSPVGVLGATSIVGRWLLPRLAARPGGVRASSRSADDQPVIPGVSWSRPGEPPPAGQEPVRRWVAICPIWILAELLDWLEPCGIERLVAISSTSRDTKADSPDVAERRLAARLTAAEERLGGWSQSAGISLTILRPTMIYDGIHDHNVAAIAAIVRRVGWFPLCGAATGLRQPVHAEDVASACLAALDRNLPGSHYTLSGGEALPFCDLVTRTCRAHGLPARTVRVPQAAWPVAAAAARLGGFAGGLAGIGRRMNEDLSCGHAAAAAELDFRPRPFTPGGGTLGSAVGIVATRPNGRRNRR
jgi:uncharacterized protein YbjT (DUF2867 family)